ncbi:MAG: hypothetical protein EXS35_12705 [Pedosphaera sp.]|nr:hypothetical protein [Pedosphaera sp.]
MKKHNLTSIWAASLALVGLLISLASQAAPITKADNTNALGTAASWVGGVAPTSADVATWSGAYSASPNSTALLTNSLRAVGSSATVHSWQGVSVGALTGTALTTNTFYAGTTGFGAETNIGAATQVGNIVTITTRAAHGYAPGMSVTIAGVTPAGYNGTFTVLGVPAGTTFTYSTGSGLTAGTAFGTVEGTIYIGGTATAAATSSIIIGSAGIDLSTASHSVVIAATDLSFNGNQTWNVPAGKNLRVGNGGLSAAGTKFVTSGADGIIDISGGGVVDCAQGGASGFGDVAGLTGFTGKWRINSGATLRGLRNGATAWGSNPGADAITLNGGTLAVGGMSGAVGNWTWTNGITLAAATTSSIDEQNVAGTGRSLLLNGVISGSGNLVFKESLVGATTFTSQDAGFILAAPNIMSGTVTIGGPVENGIAGRLTFVRVGGLGGINTGTGIGGVGSLGTAAIVNNGVLTFSLNTAITVNPITGSGSVRVGLSTTAPTAGAESQNVTLSGANTYSGDTTVNIGTLTLGAGATIPNTPNIFLVPRTGGSLIASTLDVSAAGGITLSSGQRIVGGANNGAANNTAQVTGNVTAGTSSAIVPGGTNVVNTLVINGDLNLTGGATLVYDLNTVSSGDLLTVANLNPSGVTTFAITPPPGGLAAGNYPLITASGTLGGSAANFAHNLVSAGRGQTFSIVYNGNTVELQVIGSPAALVWRGDGAANVWNTHNGTSGATNWINGGSPDAFFTTDSVLFDDTGSNTPPIALTGGLQAASITVAAAQNYTFAGSGQLSGNGPLTNAGPGTLSIVTSNNFSGKTFLTGGTLSITNESALGANPSTLTADQLTFDGGTLTVPATVAFTRMNRGITVAAGGGTLNLGAGTLNLTNRIAGTGTLTKSGAGNLTLLGTNTTFTGVTVISNGIVKLGNAYGAGGSGFFGGKITVKVGTFDINGATNYANAAQSNQLVWLCANANTITLGGGAASSTAQLIDSTGTNGFGVFSAYPNPSIRFDASGDPGMATVSAFWKQNGQSTLATNIVEVNDSANAAVELDFTGGLNGAHLLEGRRTTIEKTGTGVMRISSANGFAKLLISGGTLLCNNAAALGAKHTIDDTALPPNENNVVTMNSGVLDLNGFSYALGGLAGSSGNVRNNGGAASTLTVGFNNTNSVSSSCDAVIENGTSLVALTKVGTGTLTLGGANTYTGGTTVSNGTLLVNGSIVNGATVRSGGTLGGNGTISGVVTVDAGGALAAGTSIGTLTLNSSPVLNGAVSAEVDRNGGTPLADLISVPGNPIAYNGTLVVTNTGLPLQTGDTFTVFSAASYSGSFAIVSQTPGQLVVWNTANLAVNGTISVTTVAPAPITALVSGSNLNLTWPLEAAGAQLQVQTNSLDVGISTNWFGVPGSTGVNALSVPIVVTNPTVFLRLAYPPQ